MPHFLKHSWNQESISAINPPLEPKMKPYIFLSGGAHINDLADHRASRPRYDFVRNGRGAAECALRRHEEACQMLFAMRPPVWGCRT